MIGVGNKYQGNLSLSINNLASHTDYTITIYSGAGISDYEPYGTNLTFPTLVFQKIQNKIKHQTSNIKHQKSKIKNQKSKIKNQKSKIKNQKSKIKK